MQSGAKQNKIFFRRNLQCAVSALVKAMFYPTWKLAFSPQSVEPDSTLQKPVTQGLVSSVSLWLLILFYLRKKLGHDPF